MKDAEFDETAIPALATELRSGWRRHDSNEVDRIVGEFSAIRQRLVLDWMPAMLAYHVPEWRPNNRKVGFRPISARSLVAQLDVAMFALITPLTEMFQISLKRKCNHGPTAMLVTLDGVKTPVGPLVDQLSECEGFRDQIRCMNEWFTRCNEDAVEETVLLFSSSEEMKRLVAECAAYRFMTAAIAEKDPSVHLSPQDGPKVLAEQLSSAALSGSSILYRLADVFSFVAATQGLAVTEEVLQRNVIENKLLTGIARLESVDSAAMSRIVAGCDEFCYSTNEAVIRTNSPHRGYFDMFENVDDFRDRHWRYMWFDPAKFALFGSSADSSRLGLAEHLESSIDPLTGHQVADAKPRHPRMGCPALAYKGVHDLAATLGAVLEHPVVRDRMNKTKPRYRVEGSMRLEPPRQLLERIAVHHDCDFGELDYLVERHDDMSRDIIDLRSRATSNPIGETS